jgi:outer membrane protein
MFNPKPLLLTLALTLTGMALAAATGLNLEGATKLAVERNADIASSRATLENARADLRVKEADPTTLVGALLLARNTAALEAVKLENKRLEVFGNVLTAYANLFEAQENLEVLEAQVLLDARNVEVAKAKLASKNGTALDVSKAESTLSSSRQSLADAKAQLPILSNKLEALIGANGDLKASEALALTTVKLDAAALESGLESRVSSVVQAAQAVGSAELNVKLSDNDYTPISTLRDYQTQLENAKRSLDSARSSAVTNLRDAIRSAGNSRERVTIASKDFENNKEGLAQDQQRFKNGTISRVQLQQSEVAALKSQYAFAQAINLYWKALSTVSTASGRDVIGLMSKFVSAQVAGVQARGGS